MYDIGDKQWEFQGIEGEEKYFLRREKILFKEKKDYLLDDKTLIFSISERVSR